MTELDKALKLARLGFRVLACNGKRPIGGARDGILGDPAAITAQWEHYPNASAAIATGGGFLVVDVDVRGGRTGYKTLAEHGFEIPDTHTYVTPSGGRHYVYRVPAGQVAATRHLQGVDVQAEGAIAVHYGPPPEDLSEVADAPQWAVEDHREAQVPPATREAVERFLDLLGDKPITPSVKKALNEAVAMGGDHGTMLKKIWHVERAVLPFSDSGQWLPVCGRAAFDELEAALRASHELKYSDFDRQWFDALSKVVAAVTAPEPEDTPEPSPSELGPTEDTPSPLRRKLRVISPEELLSRPTPGWWIEGWIQEEGVVVFAGDANLGKSTAMLDMSCCIATGRPWHGKRTKRGKVLYVIAEGASFFGLRFAAWQQYYKAQVPTGQHMFLDEGFSLTNQASVDELIEIVVQDEYDVIILDTLSQLADIESENDNAQLSRVLRVARDIRQARPGSTVVLVHHVSKSTGKVRGASAIRGNSDTVIIARREDNAAAEDELTPFYLSTFADKDGKQRNAAPETLHGFRLVEVPLEVVPDTVSIIATRDATGDADVRRILALAARNETFKLQDVLEAGFEFHASSARKQQLRRKLSVLVSRGELHAEGSTNSRTYRLAPKAAA